MITSLTTDCPESYGFFYKHTPQNAQDAPTVADYTPPYATAQVEKEPVYKTLGELWGAHMSRIDSTQNYLAM